MRVSEFTYHLPQELIAQRPAEPRENSRLLVLGRSIEHRLFRDLPEYLRPGDVLVLNNSRVIPARLRGRKSTGGRAELLVLRQLGEREAECLGRRLREGAEVEVGGVRARVVERREGKLRVRFSAPLQEVLQRAGEVPLPPYIKEGVEAERYQTVYASRNGSVAAPTAGLHFSEEMLERLRGMGVELCFITLHIGVGTFAPVRCERVEEHVMHEEWYEVPGAAAEALNRAMEEERRIFAVGTSTIRTLESACQEGRIRAGSGVTELFIYPGYNFRVNYAGMITNFHLPRSTPLLMVCAFAGKDRILEAYRIAVEKRYRFYSFGDAMLILR